LKILHLIETPGPGGAEKALVDVAYGVSADYPSMGLEMCPGSWTGQELRKRGIEVLTLPLLRAFDFSWPRRFAAVLREHEIGCVHSHEFTGNCYGTAGARLAGVPIVCTTHGKNYWPEKLYRRLAYRWVARQADAFVFVSDDLAKFAAGVLGVDSSRLRIVKNGVDTHTYRRDPVARERVRAELGLSQDQPLVVAVGSLYPVKGHAILLEAFARTRAHDPAAQLAIVGDGPLRGALEEQIRQLGLAGAARILGRRADIPDVLNAADLFVMSSLSEGLPLALLEAMAVGLPVISTAVGGIPEVVVPNQTGWLAAPADADDLAEKIRFALQHRELRSALAEAGMARCIDEHSLDKTVTEFTRIYRVVASNKPAKSYA
jgi:glycosyltransferase involved in cell wall biosynthesis